MGFGIEGLSSGGLYSNYVTNPSQMTGDASSLLDDIKNYDLGEAEDPLQAVLRLISQGRVSADTVQAMLGQLSTLNKVAPEFTSDFSKSTGVNLGSFSGGAKGLSALALSGKSIAGADEAVVNGETGDTASDIIKQVFDLLRNGIEDLSELSDLMSLLSILMATTGVPPAIMDQIQDAIQDFINNIQSQALDMDSFLSYMNVIRGILGQNFGEVGDIDSANDAGITNMDLLKDYLREEAQLVGDPDAANASDSLTGPKANKQLDQEVRQVFKLIELQRQRLGIQQIESISFDQSQRDGEETRIRQGLHAPDPLAPVRAPASVNDDDFVGPIERVKRVEATTKTDVGRPSDVVPEVAPEEGVIEVEKKATADNHLLDQLKVVNQKVMEHFGLMFMAALLSSISQPLETRVDGMLENMVSQYDLLSGASTDEESEYGLPPVSLF